jgi:hypothetical protein
MAFKNRFQFFVYSKIATDLKVLFFFRDCPNAISAIETNLPNVGKKYFHFNIFRQIFSR